jgi:hypothetical protein
MPSAKLLHHCPQYQLYGDNAFLSLITGDLTVNMSFGGAYRQNLKNIEKFRDGSTARLRLDVMDANGASIVRYDDLSYSIEMYAGCFSYNLKISDQSIINNILDYVAELTQASIDCDKVGSPDQKKFEIISEKSIQIGNITSHSDENIPEQLQSLKLFTDQLARSDHVSLVSGGSISIGNGVFK